MKKLMKRKTALIIGIIFVILIFGVFFWYFQNKYQKYYEDVPELVAVLPDGEEVPMLCYYYNWTYKGEEKTSDTEIIDVQTYDFPEEYTILTRITSIWTWSPDSTIYLKSNLKYCRTSYMLGTTYSTTYGNSNSFSDADMSKTLYNGEYCLVQPTSVGEYLCDITIDYKNQGRAYYAIKVIAFDEDIAKTAKSYLNTSIENEDTIKELVSEISYSEYLQDISIEGTNLNLKYEYYIMESTLKMSNLALFACIPELETITYTAENTNVYDTDSETGETIIVEQPEAVFTRESVDSENDANIENLLKYMEDL